MSSFVILLGYFLLAALFAIVFLRKFFFLVRVTGESMLPTFQDGDFLLAIKHRSIQKLKKGQIIIWQPLSSHPAASKLPYNFTDVHFIKRLIGLPGDQVVQGQFTQVPARVGERTHILIPPGHCFVQGDSPGYDSHLIGPIPLDWVQGIVVFRIKQQNISLESPKQGF